MSVRIMLKHELRPSSLTCSSMAREPGCHFAFLREGGGGGWLWFFFPLAAQSPSGFEAVSQFQTNPKGRLKASSSLSVLSLLANPLQRSYNACSPSNLRSTILFTRCKHCIPPRCCHRGCSSKRFVCPLGVAPCTTTPWFLSSEQQTHHCADDSSEEGFQFLRNLSCTS